MFTGHLLHIVRLKGTKITPLKHPPSPNTKKKNFGGNIFQYISV